MFEDVPLFLLWDGLHDLKKVEKYSLKGRLETGMNFPTTARGQLVNIKQ